MGHAVVQGLRELGEQLRRHWKDAVGLALYLGWVYCAFFGCGLAEPDPASVGRPADWSLERLWMAAGAAQALGAVAGLALDLLARRVERHDISRPVHIAALACAVLGTVTLWASWFDGARLFETLFWGGGALCGVAMALFTMAWGRRLSSFDEMRIEFTVPLAFTVAFVLYLIMLLWKPSSVFELVVVCLMAVLSCALLTPRRADGQAGRSVGGAVAASSSQRRGVLSFLVLVAALWVQVAYFRVLATPALSGNRFTHYLYPCLMAAVVPAVMLLLCIRISRYLNITLAYRWGLPLFVLAYVPVFIGYDDPTLRIAAYAINFLGMFGVQFGCWIGASKYVRRSRTNPGTVFGTFALGEGLGIFVGCFLGLEAVQTLDRPTLMSVSMVLLVAVEFVALAVGFNPNWTFNRAGRRPCAPMGSVTLAPGAATSASGGVSASAAAPVPGTGAETSAMAGEGSFSSLGDVLRSQAESLRITYGLTSRETEVAMLLLGGRTRAYIRDELFVSLNTVGVHVRNIFAKGGVHSVQELMDLARHDENAAKGQR